MIVVMPPIGSRHAACVLQLNRVFATSNSLAGRALVQVQNPLAASDRSEPQPDLMLLAPREDSYASGHPGPEDVMLLLEVAGFAGTERGWCNRWVRTVGRK